MATYISEDTGKPVTIECRFCRKFTERHVPATRLEGQWAGGDADVDPQWVPVCDFHAAEWHRDSLTSEPIPVEQRLPSFTFDAPKPKPKFTVYDYAAHARNCVARNVTGPGSRCENPARHGDYYVIEEGENR